MANNKTTDTNVNSDDATHQPRGHFSKVFLLSNIFVVCLMIGVTVFIDRMHNVFAASNANKKDETVKIINVAAIGDSITFGATPDETTREKNAYPTQLQSLLGKGYKVHNYGLSGRTLLSTTSVPYTTEDAYVTSHETNPDVVLIMLGTNDTRRVNWNAEAYESELTSFVNGYKALPSKPKVYLLTIPPIFNYLPPVSDDEFNQLTGAGEVVPSIRRVAKKTNVSIIDIYNALRNRPDLFYDGVHPTAEGYKMIAQTVFKAMNTTGGAL